MWGFISNFVLRLILPLNIIIELCELDLKYEWVDPLVKIST